MHPRGQKPASASQSTARFDRRWNGLAGGFVTGRWLVVTSRALPWRTVLEPTAWLVLEELVIDCWLEGATATSAHNARTLGERLGRSKDAMARALRGLVQVGLIERVVERDLHSSRFTSSHYVVDLHAAGMAVVDESNGLDVIESLFISAEERGDATSDIPANALRELVGDEGEVEKCRSTNLHPGAAPRSPRPASGRADTAGTMGRPCSPPGLAAPGLFDPDPDGQ